MSGLAIKLYGLPPVSIPTEKEVKDFCPCDFRCDFEEYAFAGSNDYNSDKSSFLFRKVTDLDTITLELNKNGIKVSEIIDDSLGVYYPSFTNQDKYVGFICDWTKVYNAHGYGSYTLSANFNIIGNEYTETSRKFKVMQFDERIAWRTVKIESLHENNIVSSEFDYKGLIEGGWYESIRLNGKFKLSAELQEDVYLNSLYQQQQNKETTTVTYEVELYHLDESILYTRLIGQDLMANYSKLSGYDIMSSQEYRNIEVKFSSYNSLDKLENGMYNATLNFTDYVANKIKRNA